MVFFNYTTMQVSAKIVYYGPGLCGKTTNLAHIHGRTDPGSRGEMVSLKTEADRTLFFDLLPLEVGVIGGMRVKLQLYTVPGQVFYNTTRKLVLKGVDGIVFVADSQIPAMDGNVESFCNLQQNLEELSQPLENIPFVIQFNKRDLRNVHPVETLQRYLNPKGYEVFEGAALHGIGVFETLKAISKKTLASVHRRISRVKAPPEKVAVPSYVQPDSPPPPRREEVRDVTKSPPESIASNPPSLATTQSGEKTGEMNIEFAASPGAIPAPPPSGPKRHEPRIATQSKLDIERELDKLRQIALGEKPLASAAGRTTVGDKLEASEELARQVRVKVPRETLKKASSITVDLKVGGGDSVYEVPEVVRVELPSHRTGQKIRLRVTLDMEEE